MKAPAITYKPVTFAQLPGWEQDDHAAAFKAFRQSCERVLASARERAAAEKGPAPTPPPAPLVAACAAAAKLPGTVTKAAAKAFFEQNFTPNAVTHAGPQGLLTGYYEPVLLGSRTPQGAFQTPIYKRPPDLVNLVDETQRGAKSSALTHARKTDKGTEPYATRAQIEQGALKGKNLELIYFADSVDVFFMQIQGSGRVKLTDGSTIRIHYDGKNGHPYSSIGRYLIEKGLLAADKVSMGALKRWLKADPERGKQVMWQNASYVFFRELKGPEAKGPLGAMNAQLTPGRSLAVDPGHHALGTPIYVTAADMTHVVKAGAFNRLMVAQDVGSAIKGPERGDIYFGSGDTAGKLAGVTKHPGTFIVLLPNDPGPCPGGQGAAMSRAAASLGAASPASGTVTPDESELWAQATRSVDPAPTRPKRRAEVAPGQRLHASQACPPPEKASPRRRPKPHQPAARPKPHRSEGARTRCPARRSRPARRPPDRRRQGRDRHAPRPARRCASAMPMPSCGLSCSPPTPRGARPYWSSPARVTTSPSTIWLHALAIPHRAEA